MTARVTIRLPEQLAAWLAELGGDQAATARALMVLGAAQLALPGAEREAWRLLAQEPGQRAAEALAGLAAKRQPSGSQAAVIRQPSGSDVAAVQQPAPVAFLEELLDDPLAGVGIEV